MSVWNGDMQDCINFSKLPREERLNKLVEECVNALPGDVIYLEVKLSRNELKRLAWKVEYAKKKP